MLDAVKPLDTGRYLSLGIYLLFEHWWRSALGLCSRGGRNGNRLSCNRLRVWALVCYFFSRYNQASKLPLGTLIANLLGCFLIGLLYNHVESKGSLCYPSDRFLWRVNDPFNLE